MQVKLVKNIFKNAAWIRYFKAFLIQRSVLIRLLSEANF